MTLLLCSRATVAADRRPSKDPDMDSVRLTRVAATEPLPAMFRCMLVSIGTGLSRALNALVAWVATIASKKAVIQIFTARGRILSKTPNEKLAQFRIFQVTVCA
jgi:hypothetical protein